MLYARAIGAGGNGGNGAIGANSAAAGGGGGSSGGQSTLLIPLALLPDVLYVCVGVGGSGIPSFIAIAANTPAAGPSAPYILLTANAGNNGGNAAGATAGAAGTAPAASNLASCTLAGLGVAQFLGGQAGIIGGVAVAGANLTLPATGLLVTGGTGGGGLPAAAAAGTNGGNITGSAQTGTIYEVKTINGGVGSATATNPADSGKHGFALGQHFYLGGTGGASTHGTAAGGGLVQSNGGDGAYGCGGGGSGGALTGSAAGRAGSGGAGLINLITW